MRGPGWGWALEWALGIRAEVGARARGRACLQLLQAGMRAADVEVEAAGDWAQVDVGETDVAVGAVGAPLP